MKRVIINRRKQDWQGKSEVPKLQSMSEKRFHSKRRGRTGNKKCDDEDAVGDEDEIKMSNERGGRSW